MSLPKPTDYNKFLNDHQAEEDNTSMDADEFANKARSSKEIYELLAYDANKYMPPYKGLRLRYCQQVLAGKKK